MLFCNRSFLGCYGDKAYAVPFLLTLSCSRSNSTVNNLLGNLFIYVSAASSDLYYLRYESFFRYICLELILFHFLFSSNCASFCGIFKKIRKTVLVNMCFPQNNSVCFVSAIKYNITQSNVLHVK